MNMLIIPTGLAAILAATNNPVTTFTSRQTTDGRIVANLQCRTDFAQQFTDWEGAHGAVATADIQPSDFPAPPPMALPGA